MKNSVLSWLDETGKPFGWGTIVNAETLKEALKKEDIENKIACGDTCGGMFSPVKQLPVSGVYEMILVPEADWKKLLPK